jgi:hypothetical protein
MRSLSCDRPIEQVRAYRPIAADLTYLVSQCYSMAEAVAGNVCTAHTSADERYSGATNAHCENRHSGCRHTDVSHYSKMQDTTAMLWTLLLQAARAVNHRISGCAVRRLAGHH